MATEATPEIILDPVILRADIEALMAERAALPATGPTAWQYREARKRLRDEIETFWDVYDVALTVEEITHPLP